MLSKVKASGRVSGFLSSSLSTIFLINGDILSGSGADYPSTIELIEKYGSSLTKGCFPFYNN